MQVDIIKTTKSTLEQQIAYDKASKISKAPKSNSKNEESDQPEPLPSLPSVIPFDYDYLPEKLRNYVKDISERMQCPADFAAVGAFVMIATIVGRKIGIRPMKHNDWTVIPNLWGEVVGNSGIMKSPTLNEVLFPLKKLQAKAFEEFNKAITEHEAKAELIKIQKSVDKSNIRKALKNSNPEEAIEILKPKKNRKRYTYPETFYDKQC